MQNSGKIHRRKKNEYLNVECGLTVQRTRSLMKFDTDAQAPAHAHKHKVFQTDDTPGENVT